MGKKTQKLKKRFLYKGGNVEISLIDWEDGTPLGYLWVGSRKTLGGPITHDFDLTPKQAVELAKNILLAAKKARLA